MELLPAGLQQVDIAGGVDGIAQLSVLPLTEPMLGHCLNHGFEICEENIYDFLNFKYKSNND